jgi:hypothetical protein
MRAARWSPARVALAAALALAVDGRVAAAETPEPAPRPDQASGVARADDPPAAERLLWIPRALLFLPRMAVWGVGQPIRGGAYMHGRYDLVGRVREALFNVDGTFGIYPVARYESGFGFTAGARLVHKDLLGRGERLKLRADVGGRYRQAYGVHLRSGERFGRIAVELDASYERRPLERFYGIGDGDAPAAPPAVPIDPSAETVAIASRFREDVVRNVATVDAPIAGDLRARTSGALMLRSFAGTGGDDSIERVYRTDRLVGWEGGVRNAYVEQELVYDSRRPGSIYQSRAFDATGWLARAHAGLAVGLGGDRSDFFTYGGEVQRYLDLYDGSRVLVLRAMVEAIGGSDGRTDGEISFIDLPRLGGSEYLRGYPSGRFRDRAVALGTAEFVWDLGNYAAAYAFVDAGRALGSLTELGAGGLRVGFGGGVQLHTGTSFLARVQLAGSRDGDFALELVLSPAFGRRERAGRF